MLLKARDIFFSYGDRAVLRDVSVELAAGEVVALLGPNGAGKSTLMRVLLGQLTGRGEILWEGRAVGTWPRRQLSRRVAYLPQSPNVEGEQRVGEVLATGRAPYWGAFGLETAEDLRVVGEVARELGLVELTDRPMAELSGGQRQRVFLGRSLVQQPGALLLDEPNTFLDLRYQVELGKKLKALAAGRGMGVLMASHDLNLAAMVASRLILLKDGEVAAEGTPREVLREEVVSRVYGIAMRRVEPGDWKHPLVFPGE